MALTPEEKAAIKAELARRKTAAATTESYVTAEQYKELEGLYNAAKKAAAGNMNKKTPETAAFQKRYHELLPEEARKIIASSKKPTAKGESLPFEEKHSLASNEDAMFGPRTEQYWQSVKTKPAEEVKPPVEVVKEPEADREPLQQNTPVPYTEGRNAPWWLQDIVKTYGAVADKARIKKYNPWQATPQVRLPEATFYDPTRELAANTEMANMAMQNSAAFSNPQQQAAANSVAQGQMAKAAADVMGRYNNLNVGVANQLSEQQTGILNQASQNKANLDTQLFDKYTIANQQFDNSKAQARQQIRQSYIDAITNRANTANLNSMYPQYAVDPSSGGFTYFKNPKALDPTKDRNDFESQYARALKITGDPDRALKYMHLQATGKLGTVGPNGYPAGE